MKARLQKYLLANALFGLRESHRIDMKEQNCIDLKNLIHSFH